MTEPIKARLSGDKERFVSEDWCMLLPDEHPPPMNVNLLLITKWGKLIVGKWNDKDCCEWQALPSRAPKRK